jgi:peptidoglycan/xylan/chitin deacetylase (PgdA/CDA1 family)
VGRGDARLQSAHDFNVVKNYTRNGSVIVFHDSLKAERNMREAMPRAIEWLQEQGYEFKVF